MKKIQLFSLIFLLCFITESAFCQADSTEIRVFNRSNKDVFLSLGYYKEIDDLPTLCTYGWFKLDQGKDLRLKIASIAGKPIYYHAHNVKDRNDNWMGSTSLMVHPQIPFFISYADNAAMARSLEKNMTQGEVLQFEAYPFRQIKKNPKGYFLLNLIN
jgi:uncharacterized membrane protein